MGKPVNSSKNVLYLLFTWIIRNILFLSESALCPFHSSALCVYCGIYWAQKHEEVEKSSITIRKVRATATPERKGERERRDIKDTHLQKKRNNDDPLGFVQCLREVRVKLRVEAENLDLKQNGFVVSLHSKTVFLYRNLFQKHHIGFRNSLKQLKNFQGHVRTLKDLQ